MHNILQSLPFPNHKDRHWVLIKVAKVKLYEGFTHKLILNFLVQSLWVERLKAGAKITCPDVNQIFILVAERNQLSVRFIEFIKSWFCDQLLV
jgi:hypothetical protein